jgi:hypothetical protein
MITIASGVILVAFLFIFVKENDHKIKWYSRVYFRKGKRS